MKQTWRWFVPKDPVTLRNIVQAGASGVVSSLHGIANYKAAIRNVGAAGIPAVCYNFMPVVDWTRTTLKYQLPNAWEALRFEMTDFAGRLKGLAELRGMMHARERVRRQRHAPEMRGLPVHIFQESRAGAQARPILGTIANRCQNARKFSV